MRSGCPRRRFLLPALGIIALTVGAADVDAQAPATDTRTVTDRYIDLTFQRRYDELRDLYAPDAEFFDPTGDVFAGRAADGPVHGADAIVDLQKSWKIADADFDVAAVFTVGEYSLYRGTLTVQFDGSPARYAVRPFLTVLRVRDGRIVLRNDFGEYVESFELGDGFDEATNRTRAVADRYLAAYTGADLATQAELLAPDVRFQDPTAQVFGPSSGQLFESADALLARRRQIYASVGAFSFDPEGSFAANHHAVYWGTVRYAAGGASYVQPAVMIVEVHDGRVTRHWDFVDYSVGPS